MLVRFHTICDSCQSHGEEYQAHTNRCIYCGQDICENCISELCGFDVDGYGYIHGIVGEY